MISKIYFGIPAYNEAENLEGCLGSLNNQSVDSVLETHLCVNGCTDLTEKVASSCKQEFPRINLKIHHSAKGKTLAQNKIINSINDDNSPVVFLDSDTILETDCVKNLEDELLKNDKIQAVGALPIPYEISGLTLWEKFLFNMLHIRAFYPQSEISVNNVSRFKDYVFEFPQNSVSSEFELKSKIFFHGRAFMLRNKNIFLLPEENNVFDDTYLPNKIHQVFGPGSIRTRFDAKVFYKPYLSLRQHFNAYRRIYLDKLFLDKNFHEFEETRESEKTTLDWNYILSLDYSTISLFLTYFFVRNVEEKLFSILPKTLPSSLWYYDKK